MNTLFCTVFTPTYNRADLLNDLYSSLLNQTFSDFEWIIVDDGSIDNTKETVYRFIQEKKIKIKYHKVVNGGKHRAINIGLDLSCGKVFAIVDSDDKLTDNAIEKINSYFREIEHSNKKFCGVSANKGFNENEMIGTTFTERYVDAKSNERGKYNISGDKFEVYYTAILKKYKFPTFDGENFLSEIIVWNRLAKDGYLLRWFNDTIYICEYLDDGLTSNNLKILAKNPQGYALRIKEQVEFGNISMKAKLGYYSNYYFLLHKDKKLNVMIQDLNANYFLFLISIVIRKLLILIRGVSNEYETI